MDVTLAAVAEIERDSNVVYVAASSKDGVHTVDLEIWAENQKGEKVVTGRARRSGGADDAPTGPAYPPVSRW